MTDEFKQKADQEFNEDMDAMHIVPVGIDEEEMALDDQRRVKVLSPGMLVFKRFIRNKLAVVGIIILLVMFTFSFIGPLFVPYTQTQTFKGMKVMPSDYASAKYNTEERFTVAEGETFSAGDHAAYLLARGNKKTTFSSGGVDFYYVEIIPNFYQIVKLEKIAETIMRGVLPENAGISEELRAAFEANRDKESFELDGVTYIITSAREKTISTEQDIAISATHVFDAYKPENSAFVQSHTFKMGMARAIEENSTEFEIDGRTFRLELEDLNGTFYENGEPFANLSTIIVNPRSSSTFLSVEYKNTIREAMNAKEKEFYFNDPDGQEIHYTINEVNQNYTIYRELPEEVIRAYEAPSGEHWLGLDNNGMDLLTRLMYGGQISLMVGFVVIIIEMLIGVFVGGISGYFGGAVDTVLMRFVDLFNSIPFYPIVMIFGSVMDARQVPSKARIFLLMAILGILGWTGIARVVRGQILSLREQDFMTATEATGIRTFRRIWRHLIPNVMPLLIVSATAGLGGIIISEATLGFLGLGIKYPEASWGSIINVASDAHVMQSYWYMWFPAGMLILLTVLGFNFVGDGLRDAYDPKMKR